MNDELFTITESKPDALTAARSRLLKAQRELDDAYQLEEDQGPEANPVVEAALRKCEQERRAVIALETAAMKSL